MSSDKKQKKGKMKIRTENEKAEVSQLTGPEGQRGKNGPSTVI